MREKKKTPKTILHHTASLTIGFLTRPCCSIPAALSVLGVSGVSVGASIAPYRVWFLMMAAAFFTTSFYFNFIRNRNRAGMVVWGLSVLIAVMTLSGPGMAAPPTARDQTGDQASEQFIKERSMNMTKNTTHAEIPVTGMACDACARRLARVLSKTDGVSQAQVSFDGKIARIDYDCEQVDIAQLGERIEDAGFEAKLEHVQAARPQDP